NLLRPLLVRQDVARIFSAGWVDGIVAFLDMLDNSVFVDHESSTIAVAPFFIKDAVVLDYRAFEIAQQRKGDAVFCRKFFVGGNAVKADAEDLSIGRFEFGDISLIRFHFLRSTASESQDVEGEYHVLLAFEVAQFETHPPSVRSDCGAGEREVRRGLTNFQVGVWRGGPGRRRSLARRRLCRRQ